MNVVDWIRSRWLTSIRAIVIVAALLCFAIPSAISQGKQAGSSHGNSKAAKLKNPIPRTPKSIAAGRLVFERTCAICHGPNGKGNGGGAVDGGQPADLTAGVWPHGSTDGDLFTNIHDGTSDGMQEYSDVLSDTDIWNVVNFIRSIGPQSKQAGHSRPPK